MGCDNMKVAFTGYRPGKMPFTESDKDENYIRFREREMQVIKRLVERGCTHFISGMAMGFDTWVAEDVLLLKRANKALTLECAIPFPDQAKSWDKTYRKRRDAILAKADMVTSISQSYNRGCFHARNRYMVGQADVVVCAYNGQKGGTAYTVEYALKHDKIVIQIDPVTTKVSVISRRNFERNS